jgi:DNA mismatch repair protein MutL
MPRIHQLSPEEAQKIAAGEVIERPANVVKELIENALDAGARRITLFIEKAGKKIIRIVDNGYGMDEIDARACFKHHATSKISSVHDLHSINTFGFRGEALSSIASVSNVTLITKTDEADHATLLELSEGRIVSEQKASAPTGTDLSIRDILFNIPVRKKFLKTDDTEWRHILYLVHAVALSRRDIHITLYHDGKQVLNCPPVADYLSRAAQLWDLELAQAMIACSAEERGIRIEGMISDHTVYRYDRNALYFFVNGRWIKNYTLSRALMKGYANAIPASQFPTASLMITIDPGQIDINIHPRKEEVQFLHPKIVEQIIQMAVKAALEARLSAQLKTRVHIASTIPVYTPPQNPMAAFGSYSPEMHPLPTTPAYVPYNFDAIEDDGFPTQSLTEKPISAPILPEMPTQTFAVTKEATHHAVIGVYDKTYIMVNDDNGILFIDQHAAHERILYEQFRTRFADTAIITLMFPHILTFKRETLDLIDPHLSILYENGIHIKRNSETELTINATPVYLKNASLKDLITQMISCISESENESHLAIQKQMTEKVHAQMACSAAVKAGDELSSEQIQKLLTDLAQTENRFTCPHGRPTSWLLNHDEIVKKFQRNYQSKKRSFESDPLQ